MVVKTELEQFKSRWRRFIGQKTRIDKPYWTTLLNNKWMGWVENVLNENTFSLASIELDSATVRMDLRYSFNLAIDCSTMKDLRRLDNIYCQEVLIGVN